MCVSVLSVVKNLNMFYIVNIHHEYNFEKLT